MRKGLDTKTWKVIRQSGELQWFDNGGMFWTPDSDRVIWGGGCRLRAWSIDDNSLKEAIVETDQIRFPWALSPQGDQVVNIDPSRTEIQFWDVGAKKARATIKPGVAPDVTLLGVSPDGQWLATRCTDRPTCLLWHGDGRPGPSLPELSNGLTALAWGPDGRLASGHQNVVRVWNAKDGQLVWQSPRLEQAPSILALSPDGKRLAGSGVDKTIHLWDVAASTHVQTAAAHTGTVDQLAWDSEGKTFASLSHVENSVRLWNADGAAGPVLNAGEGPARQFDWTPDIQQIAVLTEKGLLRLFNTAGEKVLEVPNADVFVEWSPDGRWLATGQYKGTPQVRIYRRDGAERPYPSDGVLEMEHDSFWLPSCRRWSPNGKWLAVNRRYDASIRLWDVTANRYSPVLQGNPKPCAAVCWSSDSQHLLSINGDQTLRYWDVGNGRILATTVLLRNDQWARITDDGKVETSSPEAEKELVYVVEDPQGAQKIYDVAEFHALVAQQTAGDR